MQLLQPLDQSSLSSSKETGMCDEGVKVPSHLSCEPGEERVDGGRVEAFVESA
jgi:hypothetical protein